MRRLLMALAFTAAAICGFPAGAGATEPCRYPDGAVAPPPGPSQEAMSSKTSGPRMMALFKALSPGDRSTIHAALARQEDALLVTSPCSPNDLFWAHLTNLDFMAVANDALPPPLRDLTRAYRLTPTGRRFLPDLLRIAESLK